MDIDDPPAGCVTADFSPAKVEYASYLTSTASPTMTYGAWMLDQAYPNLSLLIHWYGERGAPMEPGEWVSFGGPLGEAPVELFIVDCPGSDASSCVYYLATSGQLYFSDGLMCGDSDLVGFIDHAILAEIQPTVSPKGHTWTSTWVADGGSRCIEHYDFSTTQWPN